MKIIVHQVPVGLGYDEPEVLQSLARKLRCRPEQVLHAEVLRRSLDARPRNPEPRYVLSVAAEVEPAALTPTRGSQDVQIVQVVQTAGRPDPPTPSAPPPRLTTPVPGQAPPLVVGSGPAGLLAAHVLAEAGARPLLIERGEAASERAFKVGRFWRDGTLDPESNALFGEGGAGLFSDGKLTARTKDHRRSRRFLELLVACGAPPSILVDATPHLGSDLLLRLIPALRERILARGGVIRFGARLEGLVLDQGRVRAAVVNGEEIACGGCVLAAGHSARDVYALLAELGVTLEPKPFAVGVRLELSQAVIDRAQYGRFAGDPRLGARTPRRGRGSQRRHRSARV